MLLNIFLDYFALFRAARCRNINEIYNNYFCRYLLTVKWRAYLSCKVYSSLLSKHLPNAKTATSHSTNLTFSVIMVAVTKRPLAGGTQRNTRKCFLGKGLVSLHEWSTGWFILLSIPMSTKTFWKLFKPRKTCTVCMKKFLDKSTWNQLSTAWEPNEIYS